MHLAIQSAFGEEAVVAKADGADSKPGFQFPAKEGLRLVERRTCLFTLHFHTFATTHLFNSVSFSFFFAFIKSVKWTKNCDTKVARAASVAILTILVAIPNRISVLRRKT